MNKRVKQATAFIRNNSQSLAWIGLAAIFIISLLLFRLGTAVPGMSSIEQTTSQSIYGWHGLSARPFYLPLNVVRSAVFVLANHHGALLTRLPNTLFGLLAILMLAILIKQWHGNRTTIFATALFASSAWLLHISRLASNDVLYLLAIPLLLVMQLLMLKAATQAIIFYGAMAISGILLYVPGLVWLVVLSLYWQRNGIVVGWRRYRKLWQRGLYILTAVIWLPLLGWHVRHLGALKMWLGLPDHIAITQIGRQLVFIPVHLLVRGPNDPQRWLGHAPLLDAFTLVCALAGIWFYAIHFRATRSRILGSYLVLGTLLVSLGGSVSLSLLVPIFYILAATGIAYLLHEWLVVFPRNPVARRLGIGLVAVAVAVSCFYNLRAYFVAWPHDRTTLLTFDQAANSGRIAP